MGVCGKEEKSTDATTLWVHRDTVKKLSETSRLKSLTPNQRISLLCSVWDNTGLDLNFENAMKVASILKDVYKPTMAIAKRG